MRRLSVSALIALTLAVVGCGSSSTNNQQVRDLQATVAALQRQVAAASPQPTQQALIPAAPSSAATQQFSPVPAPVSRAAGPTTSSSPFAPVVDTDVTVLADAYGLPDTTGYTTVVVFHVRNPNLAVAVLRIPYRVTISDAGGIIFTSDGRDTVSLAPGESHLAIFETAAINRTQPASATVQFYPAPSMYVDARQISDASMWDVANGRVVCEHSLIQCDVTADLTWKGQAPQQNTVVLVVAHAGSDNSAPIVGAGTSQSTLSVQTITPGQTVPVQASTFGYIQGVPKGALTLPSGPLTLEFYVSSSQSGP